MEKQQYELVGLARLLAASVGEEKATEAVQEAARELGKSGQRALTFEHSLEILEKVAQNGGILGVTARFAKSRLHLAAATPSSGLPR